MMYFLVEDNKKDIKKEFYIVCVYNNNFLKTKIKSHSDEVTDFCNKEIPLAYSNHTCLLVLAWILLPKRWEKSS